MTVPKKDRTAAIQKSLETRERAPIAHFDSREYVQHNVLLGEGLAPILEFMDGLPADRTRVTVTHRFEDGDYSFALADYALGDWGPMVGFEVHRWRDDRIVEHWDNLQATPSERNPSGRAMTDGTSEVSDLDRADANKAAAETFVREALIDRAAPASAHVADGLIQHHPRLADGAAALAGWIASGDDRYDRLHKVLGEGSFVLTMSEGTSVAGDGERRPAAFYDLLRFADGEIVEQWNVTEIIAPPATWANDNGKF